MASNVKGALEEAAKAPNASREAAHTQAIRMLAILAAALGLQH
jgi:hypothetical protein